MRQAVEVTNLIVVTVNRDAGIMVGRGSRDSAPQHAAVPQHLLLDRRRLGGRRAVEVSVRPRVDQWNRPGHVRRK